MKQINESLSNQSKSIRYLKAIALIAGPVVFASGVIYYSYNRMSGIGIAQSEWSRFKTERNHYLDSERAKARAQEIKAAEESKRLQERAQSTIDYYADIPAVLQSPSGMTLVNFPNLLNGEPAQYSYKLKIGQQLYDVQGTITTVNNSLSFEDNYSKTHESVMSAGEIRHEKDAKSGILTLTFITSHNIGSMSNLGDIKIHRFKYK